MVLNTYKDVGTKRLVRVVDLKKSFTLNILKKGALEMP